MVTNNLNAEVKDALNNLLKTFFKANSTADNIAYALDCELNCPVASKLYHEEFAHVFPSDKYADLLSNVMVCEGVRPVRKSFDGDTDTYDNIVLAFEDNYKLMYDVKTEILSTIELLDFYKECKVFIIILEEMALTASKMLHQSDIWRQKAKEYYESGSVRGFDKDFRIFSDFNF